MLRLILVLLFSVQLSAFADDKDVKVLPNPEVAPNTETVIDDSSEFHRLGKTFQINARLGGQGPNLGGTIGLVGGYFLNRNQLIMLELAGGSGNGFLGTGSTTYSDIKRRSVSIYFKQFLANSFYYRAGLDYRTVKYDDSFSTIIRRFDSKSFGATFNIGNQWQFHNFTIGCDWAGVTVPFATSYSNEQNSSGSSWFEDDKEDFGKDVVFNLLQFYVGASF